MSSQDNNKITTLPAQVRERLKGLGIATDDELRALYEVASARQLSDLGLTDVTKQSIGLSDVPSRISFARPLGLRQPSRPASVNMRNNIHAANIRRIIAGKERLPSQFSLIGRFGPVRDQLDIGACAGFATVGAVESALNFTRELSDLFAYWGAKQIDGDVSEGTTLEAAFRAAQAFGICSAGKWEYNPSEFSSGPPSEAMEDAGLYRVERFLQVDRNELLHYLKMLICGRYFANPRAVAVGVPVFLESWSSFITEQYGKVIDPLPGATFLGGHGIILVGYRDDVDAPEGGYFEFRNSWGPGWAPRARDTPAGYGIISYNYILNHVWETMAVVAMKEIEKPKPVSLFIHGEQNGNGRQQDQSKAKEENHTIIIGRTGSGKTSSCKSIIAQNRPEMDFFIIDFHDDYTDELFLNMTDAAVWDVLEDGIPFNIFQPPYDSEKGNTIPIPLHIQSIRNSIKICFPSMGSRQLSLISEALGLMYGSVGGNVKKIVQTIAFSDLKYYLLLIAEGNMGKLRIAESIIDNLRPIFDLRLLDVNRTVTAPSLLSDQGTIIFRCKLPDQSDEIKKLIAVFLVSGLFSQLKFSGRGSRKQKIFIQDEFHLVKEHPIWERIIREGRKFNVGLWAISQQVEDVEHLVPNVKHLLVFQAFGGTQKKRIVQQILQSNSRKEDLSQEIELLKQFEAIYMNSGGEYEKIRIAPYFQLGEGKIADNQTVIRKGA